MEAGPRLALNFMPCLGVSLQGAMEGSKALCIDQAQVIYIPLWGNSALKSLFDLG